MKTTSMAGLAPRLPLQRSGVATARPAGGRELKSHLLVLILARSGILFLGLNIAGPLGFLPDRIGGLPFLPLFNILTATMSVVYLLLWWTGWKPRLQLSLQIAVDLVLATTLVARTGGAESAFVSFYLLIIIYCSLTLGHTGALLGASLTTILYAAIIVAEPLALGRTTALSEGSLIGTFRISLHALGFFAVALLGTFLSQRLRAVQEELEEKIDSLRRLQQLHEHIVSSIRSGLITTDLSGNIAVFNNTAAELTQIERETMLQSPVQSVLGTGFWRKIVSNDFFNDLRALRHEDWVALPGGGRRFLGFSVSPLMDDDERLLGYIISFQDLTDIKKLEEEVRLKDRMAVIGRMAASLAHEIRNPLTSMQGSVEVLRSQVQLLPMHDRLLDILVRESDRLNKFVEDFLSFARRGRQERHPVDLVGLLHDCATLLRNSAEVRDKHAVTLELQPSEIFVLGSSDPLRQVFWNLSQNAVRAMPAGGELRISAGSKEAGLVEVVFEDTGVGMTAEEAEQNFQPFHSGFRGGTGLGLSIAFQIIEDHGGKIRLEGEKGRGTRVILTLPILSSASTPAVQENHAIHSDCR